MKPPDGRLIPIWLQNLSVPDFPSPPAGTLPADVVVVGAGIAGLTTAYLLAGESKLVIVLDEGKIGSGQTGRTSAHLASAVDDRFLEIERLHGLDAAKAAYHSHCEGIDLIERIGRQEAIQCDFKRLNGYLFAAAHDSPDLLQKEAAAAKRAGFADVELMYRTGLKAWGDSPAIRFGNQARFHPLKFLRGLAAAVMRRGAKIYTGCRVTDVQGAKNGSPAKATIDGQTTIEAGAIVVATNTPSPINDWMGIYLKQASYRSYVVGLAVPAGSVDDALYWDNQEPYHYVRLDDDVLLVGGQDHKTGQQPTGDPFANLKGWAKTKFPMAGAEASRWSGQVQEPADYLAYIGKAPTAGDNVFVITGDSGMGLTHAALGAILITDLIQGRTNPWASLYDPNRLKVDADLLKENTNTIAQYKDFITPGDIDDIHKIPLDSGALVRSGLSKLAVYRGRDGKIEKHSAVCTHLQCIVHWNAVEKTWDCPCHGSRFSPDGKVLMGPAVEDLPAAE